MTKPDCHSDGNQNLIHFAEMLKQVQHDKKTNCHSDGNQNLIHFAEMLKQVQHDKNVIPMEIGIFAIETRC